MRTLVVVASALLALTACGGTATDSPSGAQAEPSRRICDGSSSLRLALRGVPVMYDNPSPYVAFPGELGIDFLYVDGSCRYWLGSAPGYGAPDSVLPRYRAGTLLPDDERALSTVLHYDDTSWLLGGACSMKPAGMPGPTSCIGLLPQVQLYDGERTILWSYTVRADHAQAEMVVLRSQLEAKAQPIQGPVRVLVGVNPYANTSTLEWPLSAPITDFLVPPDQSNIPGQSKRVSDPDDLQKLEELAAAWAPELPKYGYPQAPYPAVPVTGGYAVFMRGDLPIAGDDGLVLLQ